MARMKMNVRPNAHAFRFFAGWCVLAFFVGAASPVGLGLTALLGALDADHEVRLETSDVGSRVVLHHGGNCAGHHHGLVARVLTFFAEPVRAGEPDHVLQFSPADSYARQKQMVGPLSAPFEQVVFPPIESLAWAQREAFLSSVPTQPPPGATGQRRCLRSTLLLI